MDEKPKIKLSELTEMYNIEDDVNNIAPQNSDSLKEEKKLDYETTIEESDAELEAEMIEEG